MFILKLFQLVNHVDKARLTTERSAHLLILKDLFEKKIQELKDLGSTIVTASVQFNLTVNDDNQQYDETVTSL